MLVLEVNTTSHTNWGGRACVSTGGEHHQPHKLGRGGGHVLVLEVNTTRHTNWGGGEGMC